MRLLMTGGAGFVGSHTGRGLLNAGVELFVLDSLHQYVYPIRPTYLENMRFRFDVLLKGASIVRGTTLDKDTLRREIGKIRPDVVIHFAALPLANLSIHNSDEAFNSILQGTGNLLEVLRDADYVDRLVYISSSMVYGDFEEVPVPEVARTNPKEIYGGMKLAGEILVKVYSACYGFDYAIVRPSAVYGPTDNNRRVLQIFLENALRGERLELKNGVSTYLDFTYVEDAAEGIRLVATSPRAKNETFNITKGEGRSLMEAAETIRGLVPGIEIADISEDNFYPSRGALDVTKARKLLGYNPQYGLDEGLARYLSHMTSPTSRNSFAGRSGDSGLK